jgi:hypothetical protein
VRVPVSRRTKILLGIVAILAAIQAVRPARTNPPVIPGASFVEAATPPPELARIVDRACANCHSYRTAWPWYSRIAPVSWLVVNDVNGGRQHVDLSNWKAYKPAQTQRKLELMCDEVKDGGMPPWYYRAIHPEARLSAADVAAVCGFADRADSGSPDRR